MAKKTRAKPEPDLDRRSWFKKLWWLLGGAALAEGVFIGTDFLRPRIDKSKQKTVKDGIVVAGSVKRFEPGTVTAFPAGQFYLVREKQGGFLALHRRCTHLGCTVPWDEEKGRFVCPCHASSFDIVGQVKSAPAPRPLDLCAVRIENDIVKVDTSTIMKRDSFKRDQLVFP